MWTRNYEIAIVNRIDLDSDMEKRRDKEKMDKGVDILERSGGFPCVFQRGKWWASTLRAVNAFHSLRED